MKINKHNGIIIGNDGAISGIADMIVGLKCDHIDDVIISR